MKLTVLGSGAWGTALAILLQKNRHSVTLWSHRAEKTAELQETRRNPLLKGVELPQELELTSSLDCVRESEMVVFATPSFALRETAERVKPYLAKGTILVSVTKGIERGTNLRMSQVIAEATGGAFSVAVLSGPSHAEEVARGIPTGCVAAASDESLAELVRSVFMHESFRVYSHTDVVGVELAGALKNVVALCCGISDGAGFGDNTKALIMTRAMVEMSRLAKPLGGQPETFAGLSGVGDLIVTCTSMHSRNRRAGILIGQGMSPQEAMEQVGAVVEGYYAAFSANELAEKTGIEMPICRSVYELLYHGRSVQEIGRALMLREPRHELDNSWIWH